MPTKKRVTLGRSGNGYWAMHAGVGLPIFARPLTTLSSCCSARQMASQAVHSTEMCEKPRSTYPPRCRVHDGREFNLPFHACSHSHPVEFRRLVVGPCAIALLILSRLVEEGAEWKVLVDHIIRMVLPPRFLTWCDPFNLYEDCSHISEDGNIKVEATLCVIAYVFFCFLTMVT